jgi:hypothetical protein
VARRRRQPEVGIFHFFSARERMGPINWGPHTPWGCLHPSPAPPGGLPPSSRAPAGCKGFQGDGAQRLDVLQPGGGCRSSHMGAIAGGVPVADPALVAPPENYAVGTPTTLPNTPYTDVGHLEEMAQPRGFWVADDSPPPGCIDMRPCFGRILTHQEDSGPGPVCIKSQRGKTRTWRGKRGQAGETRYLTD